MSALLRAVGMALAVASVSMASIASGEPSAPTSAPSKHAAPRKRPAKKKHKKVQGHEVTTTPRAPHSMTLAASADLSPSLASRLVDESMLPAPSVGTCPKEMASVDGRFCVDKWEGSLVEIGSWGERPVAYTETVNGREVRAVSVPGVFPQGYISGVEAGQACEKSGKRLCSSMEWRKACVGPDDLRFGYGDAREKGRCNDSGKSPMLAIWGAGIQVAPDDWNPLKVDVEGSNPFSRSRIRVSRCDDHNPLHTLRVEVHTPRGSNEVPAAAPIKLDRWPTVQRCVQGCDHRRFFARR